MANVIKPKRSNTAAKVPTTTDLSSGEFGVNMADQKSYINNGTAVVQVGAGKLVGLQDVTVTSPTSGQFLSWNGTAWVNAAGGGSGTVTSISVVSANGFAGTVATATTTPVITLTTTITGLVKGNGTAISAATSGTDYSAGTSALGTGILKSTTSTGALSIAVAADFPTLNQNTTGSSASCTGNAATATTASGVSAGVVAGKMVYDSFTATASQTTFTSSTTYTSSKIEVYCNGVKMINGSDVTVTSGTSVVFATGLAVGSLVSLVYPT
jgi:hypothetical protein